MCSWWDRRNISHYSSFVLRTWTCLDPKLFMCLFLDGYVDAWLEIALWCFHGRTQMPQCNYSAHWCGLTYFWHVIAPGLLPDWRQLLWHLLLEDMAHPMAHKSTYAQIVAKAFQKGRYTVILKKNWIRSWASVSTSAKHTIVIPTTNHSQSRLYIKF